MGPSLLHEERVPAGPARRGRRRLRRARAARAEAADWVLGLGVGRPDRRRARDATAFTDASGLWLAAEAIWDDARSTSSAASWAREALATSSRSRPTGRYVNDVAEAGEDWSLDLRRREVRAARRVKRDWDPDNVFRLNQNIQP